jgi:hypothetical protein
MIQGHQLAYGQKFVNFKAITTFNPKETGKDSLDIA